MRSLSRSRERLGLRVWDDGYVETALEACGSNLGIAVRGVVGVRMPIFIVAGRTAGDEARWEIAGVAIGSGAFVKGVAAAAAVTAWAEAGVRGRCSVSGSR